MADLAQRSREAQARYRARHPERVRAYKQSATGKASEAASTRRRRDVSPWLWTERQRRFHAGPALPIWYQDEQAKIIEFYRSCPENMEVDHIVPIKGARVSGLHTLANLQYLTRTANIKKRNKHESDDLRI